MLIALSHISALEALRDHTANGMPLHADQLHPPLYDFERRGWRQLRTCGTTASEAQDVLDARNCPLSEPLHFMVAGNAARRTGPRVQCHVYSDRLPAGSLVAIAPDRYCASPELCFYQLACELPLPLAAAVGYELCGTYGKDALSERGFSCRAALTTPHHIERHLAALGARRGIRHARAALRLVLPNAASPREAILAMLLTFPRRLGGYGLPMPVLNGAVPSCASRSGLFRCDLLWPEQKVAIEYDSDAWHTGTRRISADATRRVALERAGIRVVTITNAQVKDRRLMNEAAALVAGMLGVRMRDSTGRWEDDKIRLRETLLTQEI